MQISLVDDAFDAEAAMSLSDSDKLWDVLEEIAADVAAAQQDTSRHKYVSTRRLWGTHVPGTRYTAFWYADSLLWVVAIADESTLEF